MKPRTRSARIAVGIGILAVVAGVGLWRHSQQVEQQRAHITSVSNLKRIGLSFRCDRNDIASFTLQGQVLNPKRSIEE